MEFPWVKFKIQNDQGTVILNKYVGQLNSDNRFDIFVSISTVCIIRTAYECAIPKPVWYQNSRRSRFGVCKQKIKDQGLPLNGLIQCITSGRDKILGAKFLHCFRKVWKSIEKIYERSRSLGAHIVTGTQIPYILRGKIYCVAL